MNPDEYTNQETYIAVSDGHQIYVHDWGKSNAKTPILFLHGGPGDGCSDRQKALFDPRTQRVIFFDQRGCGKSRPYGSIKHNTTQDLVADINVILDKLDIKQVIVVGSSWGSCLGLYYAIQNSHRVAAMVLRGIFTGRKIESDWIEKGEYRVFYPEIWDAYLLATPPEHRKDPSQYHWQRILGKNEAQAVESAYVQRGVAGALLSLDDRLQVIDESTFDMNPIKIDTHYMTNDYFIEPGYIFKHAERLDVPIWLVQGRYDMICPPATAHELNEILPDGRLIWTVAGHGNDRANYDVSRTILLQLAEK